jgi:hypothetical protein
LNTQNVNNKDYKSIKERRKERKSSIAVAVACYKFTLFCVVFKGERKRKKTVYQVKFKKQKKNVLFSVNVII